MLKTIKVLFIRFTSFSDFFKSVFFSLYDAEHDYDVTIILILLELNYAMKRLILSPRLIMSPLPHLVIYPTFPTPSIPQSRFSPSPSSLSLFFVSAEICHKLVTTGSPGPLL